MISQASITRWTAIALLVIFLQVVPGYAETNECKDDVPVGADYVPCLFRGGEGGGPPADCPELYCCDERNVTGINRFQFNGADADGHWNLKIMDMKLSEGEKIVIKRFLCTGDEHKGCRWLEIDQRCIMPLIVHMHVKKFTIMLTGPNDWVLFKVMCTSCHHDNAGR